MRIRVIKPDFWQDSVVAGLPMGARLLYIGLWMVADDAGWLKWQPQEIAAGVFPYEGRGRRERWVEEWSGLLVEAGRIVIHPCGHAVIPTMTVHQKTGGLKTVKVRDSHLFCDQSRNIPKDPESSGRKGKEGKGREGKEESKHLRLVDGEWVANGDA